MKVGWHWNNGNLETERDGRRDVLPIEKERKRHRRDEEKEMKLANEIKRGSEHGYGGERMKDLKMKREENR